MLARVHSAVLDGIVARETVVEIEFDRRWAAPRWTGWVQRAARECLVRVQSALRRCGFDIAPHCIVMGADPGDPPVRSAALDLPVAIGLLIATGHLPPAVGEATWYAGELTLAGSLLPVRGALPMALAAKAAGAKTITLSSRNAREVVPWVNGIEVLGAQTLGDVLLHVLGQQRLSAVVAPVVAGRSTPEDDVIPGSPEARRALEVAAAGGHHLLLVGSPGCGKTLLASRLPLLLPPPSFEEAREAASVWSAAGLLDPDRHDPSRRPFRAPHHTVSFAGLLGGGNPTRPGEASLAHHGVLFLDELPEFNTGALDIVRHAARTGEASICRSDGTVRLPARFQLVAAANPCPCGFHGSANRPCRCKPTAIQHHQARLRFPLGDVFDIRIRVRPVPMEEVDEAQPTIAAVKNRVAAARERQERRAGRLGLATTTNAALAEEDTQRLLPPDSRARRFLDVYARRGGLETGSVLRVVRVARTLADLAGVDDIEERHVAEAIGLVDPDGPGPGLVPETDVPTAHDTGDSP
ncbi:MAG: ATP-binding protein [Deltaproteobacteria bacterium]|nr:ATP-binding protein [Deltaproteobacteria bacterium]